MSEIHNNNNNDNKSESESEFNLDEIELDLDGFEFVDNDNDNKTLKEMMNDNFVDLRGYMKYTDEKHKRCKITGKALNLNNKCINLACIDIDLPHDIDENKKMEIRNEIQKNNYNVVEQTANGGLHIYCKLDDYKDKLEKNRSTKVFTINVLDTEIDVDLFASINDAQSLITIDSSEIKNPGCKDILKYKYLKGNQETMITQTMTEVIESLEKFNLKWTKDLDKQEKHEVPLSSIAKVKPITNVNNNNNNNNENENENVKTENFIVNEEQLKALVNGIFGFTIHNYTHVGGLENEVSLMPLFKALNCIEDFELRTLAYNNAKNKCELTPNAKSRFDNERDYYWNKKSSLRNLNYIIKNYNSEYYDEHVLPLFKQFNLYDIDLNDNFDLREFIKNARNNKYKSFTHAATDLSRIIRYLDVNKCFIQKIKDIKKDGYTYSYVQINTMINQLKNIHLFEREVNGKMKKFNAFDAYIEYQDNFFIDGVVFNKDIPNTLKIFSGYKYHVLDTFNEAIISDYLKLIYDVISDSDNRVYEYILNWISFIIQNPGKQTKTAMVIKGIEGSGKNTFTDIICDLLKGYSQKNINDINEITGSYNKVLENCMFMVCNELKNAKNEYITNIDSLKSKISDDTVRIGDKFEPMRTSDNVCNFVFISNNSKPLIVSSSDRRYLVLTVNGKYRDSEFLHKLHDTTIINDDFYDNLLTYFMKRDISKFNVFDIPMTEAKKNLIQASRNQFDDFIVRYYDNFSNKDEAFTAGDLKLYYKQFRGDEFKMNDYKNCVNYIKDKCNYKCVRKDDGTPIKVYILKDEFIDKYIPNDEEKEVFESDVY